MNQVTSDMFVGRREELDRFKDLFTPEANISILNIHTNGNGGIGKTQLLLRMQDYCRSVPEKVVYTKELIDFYHTESRSRVGVMLQIVDNLGTTNFPEFEKYVNQYQDTADISDREELLPKLEQGFRKDYTAFSAWTKKQGKVIVLFFDTYEFIQDIETTVRGEQQVDTTGFSHWLETQLFLFVSENTRLIVSGRYPLKDIDRSKLAVEELNLTHFSLSDTVAFWKKCFNLESESDLAEKIGSDSLISIFHTISEGRPVLLALFADWVNYDRNPLSPEDLLIEIERRTGKIGKRVTQNQKELFEKALIERVTSLIGPEDHAITCMAVAYRRMTPDMFHFITDIPRAACRDILLNKLKPLSFIKYKKGDFILLHDEMRRLLLQHWWPEHDPVKDIRGEIAANLVRYYDEKLLAGERLSATEYEMYISELLEYALLANPQEGLERFCSEFDIALEDGKYDYADLLLREAESYHRDNPNDLLFPDYLRIRLRKIRYYSFTDKDYERALGIAEETLEKYQNNPVWTESDLLGHFLLVRGFAQSYLDMFEESVDSFHEAKNVFYDLGKDYWLYRTSNSIGYAYYRQGRFVEAERYLAQSINGFSKLLAERGQITKREHRQLLQGLQLSLGNLAGVYGYTGRFEKAIRYAEIVLDIARNLPYNNQEIARARMIVGHQHAVAGHSIDAQHNLAEAEQLLMDIRNRTLTGRTSTDLGILLYRVDEFSYLLEYYRAEEIEEMLKGYVQYEQIEKAEKLLQKAIRILSERPAIKKELADAYYALGELYMVTPTDDHWQKAESAFLKGLKWGKTGKFLYGVIDTLESLVTLYCFWNGTSGISEEVKKQNQRKMTQYQQELDLYDPMMYPNLFGKYRVALGDIEFDKALELLQSGNKAQLNAAITALKNGFTHYVIAAGLMKQFNEDRYYLTLRVFYNRLNVLIDKLYEKKILFQEMNWMRELKTLWDRKAEELKELRTFWLRQEKEFEQIFYYIQLRIRPKEKLQQINQLYGHFQDILNQGGFGLASLLSSCLIGAYTALISSGNGNEEYREKRILQLNAQSGYYRTLGDEYQAELCIWACRREIEQFSDSYLQMALEGSTDCSEGTWMYRRGEYGRLLEFYLQDELGVARKRFEQRYPGARDRAFMLLREGEEKLKTAIAFWEEKLTNVDDLKEQSCLEARIRRYRKNLGEVRFRLGELLMLNEEFEDVAKHKGAFSYLQEAVDDSESSGDTYRHDNAVQSYINALYFSKKYSDPDYIEKHSAYEKRLEEKLRSKDPSVPFYASIMSRLRIVQGDALFSRCFKRIEKPGGEYTYIPREGRVGIRPLRTMLRYYVEACNFMAQHSAKNFASAVRVVQRRIRLISDRHSIQVIQRGFVDVWTGQEYLKEKKDEMETLIQFANIRSIMLENRDNN